MSTTNAKSIIDLPAELRNAIYESVALSDEEINIITHPQPALTRTCRQLRRECLSIYTASNNFVAVA